MHHKVLHAATGLSLAGPNHGMPPGIDESKGDLTRSNIRRRQRIAELVKRKERRICAGGWADCGGAQSANADGCSSVN